MASKDHFANLQEELDYYEEGSQRSKNEMDRFTAAYNEERRKAELEKRLQDEDDARVLAQVEEWKRNQPAERFLREQLAKAVSLREAFSSSESIGDRVSNFDFSSVVSSDTPGFHAGLAPAYGKLTTESFRAMDNNLKIIMASSMRSICSVPEDQRNFDSITEAFVHNPLLESVPDGSASRCDSFRKSGNPTVFKDGGVNQGVVNEVISWFTAFIKDEDVLKDVKIDINVLGQLVAQTGVNVTSFETLFHAEAHRRKTVIDIGVMRFPDIERPFIQIYKIKLQAWSDSVRDLMVERNSSGVDGEYSYMKYVPNTRVMDLLTTGVHGQAVTDAENLFD